MALPEHGMSPEAIFAELDDLQRDDVQWRNGRAFSLVYYGGPDVSAVAEEAYRRYSAENALNTDAFPGLRAMLAVIGEESLDSLLSHTVPDTIRLADSLDLDGPRSPQSVLDDLRHLAAQNVPRTSLIGMGYYGTITPPVIVRNVLESPAWYTAYTPYQPEISQGRLEALLNFQTMVAELTGFDLANASLLDEATAAAEAMTMCRRLSTSDSHRFFVHHDTHPQTIAVLATRAEPVGIELVVGDVDEIHGGCFGALFSLPTSSGAITDWRHAISAVHGVGGLAVVATDLMACMLAVPPAHLSADIAIGSAQRFGVSMGFGGPHAAFIAASESVARALPGRLVGVSTDTEGRPAMARRAEADFEPSESSTMVESRSDLTPPMASTLSTP